MCISSLKHAILCCPAVKWHRMDVWDIIHSSYVLYLNISYFYFYCNLAYIRVFFGGGGGVSWAMKNETHLIADGLTIVPIKRTFRRSVSCRNVTTCTLHGEASTSLNAAELIIYDLPVIVLHYGHSVWPQTKTYRVIFSSEMVVNPTFR